MTESCRRLWEAMHLFHKLNVASILPVSKAEFLILNGISGQKVPNPLDLPQEVTQGVRMSELAGLLHILPPAASRSIKSLEEKGYVRRYVNAKDRRNTMVEITEEGKAVFEEANRILDDFIVRVFAQTDKEKLEELIVFIEQQYTVASEELRKIRADQQDEKKGSLES